MYVKINVILISSHALGVCPSLTIEWKQHERVKGSLAILLLLLSVDRNILKKIHDNRDTFKIEERE